MQIKQKRREQVDPFMLRYMEDVAKERELQLKEAANSTKKDSETPTGDGGT